MILDEYGFWDYTTPYQGGMEAYDHDDYERLLDDMAEAGMNSLVVVVKWITTGYRSKLPFLDQLPGNAMIESDNELLRTTIIMARERGIRVWIGAVVSLYVVERFGGTPYAIHDSFPGGFPCVPFGIYDADHPEFTERAVMICEELISLFPDVSGLMVELEGCGQETPDRIPLYESWAAERGKRSFNELGHPFNPRCFDAPEWRDYTTYRRTEVLRAIESAVREHGFTGELATIFESSATQSGITMEVNLAMMREQCPNWSGIGYEHDKWNHRYGSMDVNVESPREFGHRISLIPRGVMTWCDVWPMPISIQENWRRDVEDIELFRPDGAWWFGTGTRNEGAGTALSRLRDLGFSSGEEARRALLNATRSLRGRSR